MLTTRPFGLLAALVMLTMAGVCHAAGAGGRVVRDCRDCPQMVMVPAGAFTMGTDEPLGPAGPPSPSTTNAFGNARMANGPPHTVRIAHAFALGRYEVTRAEFARFVAATHYAAAADCSGLGADGEYAPGHASWRNPGFAQTDRDPVLCVSWNDAEAYVAWLSRKTGRRYRLPSDAEWEYAQRAGGTSRFWWGEKVDDSCAYANLADLDAKAYPSWKPAACHDGHATSSPVGSYRPNGFGLYDMAGNAWEFVQDCAHDGYTADAPADGGAWEGGGCGQLRLRRGGAFDHTAASTALAASRLAQEVSVRKGNTGFRIARD